MNINLKVLGFPLAILFFIIVMLIPTPGLSFAGHAAMAEERDERMVRDHQPDHSDAERREDGNTRASGMGDEASGFRRAGALHGVSSGFQTAGQAANASGNAAPRA